MSIKDWRINIEDMLEAIKRIKSYCQGMDEASFTDDTRTTDAVVHNLEIIGEASHHLPAFIIQKYATIPWSHMVEMRHILVHEYHAVNTTIIWRTVYHDLLPLFDSIAQILKDYPTDV